MLHKGESGMSKNSKKSAKQHQADIEKRLAKKESVLGTGEKKKSTWVFILSALIVIGAGGYFVLRQNEKEAGYGRIAPSIPAGGGPFRFQSAQHI